jgi:hypothetical protein
MDAGRMPVSGAVEYVDMMFSLMWRACGMKVEAAAVRP